jgi:hypothetical protein
LDNGNQKLLSISEKICLSASYTPARRISMAAAVETRQGTKKARGASYGGEARRCQWAVFQQSKGDRHAQHIVAQIGEKGRCVTYFERLHCTCCAGAESNLPAAMHNKQLQLYKRL